MDIEVMGADIDWNQPYSCEEWDKKFQLTFPILDNSKGRQIYNYFGDGIVPHNVVIDRNGGMIYSRSGFKKQDIVNTIESGLKTSKTDSVYLKKKKPKSHDKIRYQKLRKIKGYD